MDESDEPNKCGFAMIAGIRSVDDRNGQPAWTRELVVWNTIGTIAGAVVGLCALAVSIIAIVITLVH